MNTTSRSTKANVLAGFFGVLAFAILLLLLRPEKPLAERCDVEQIILPNLDSTLWSWVSEQEVLIIRGEDVIEPTLFNTITGQQSTPQQLANLLASLPLQDLSFFTAHSDWCLFYFRIESENAFVRLLTKIDASVWRTNSIESVFYEVYWHPDTLAWMEVRNTLEGADWYLCQGESIERRKVREVSNRVRPIGFVKDGSFVVSAADFPASPPITLEYWEFDPSPRIVKTVTIPKMPDLAYVAKPSPTGEAIAWAWSRQDPDGGRVGLAISSADTSEFKFVGELNPDPYGTFVPWWTASGESLSFVYKRTNYLLKVDVPR